MNIVCLKWGELYGPHYVNRLYNQCKKFIKLDFDFYCVTDDSDGINENVNILDISDYQFEDGVYGGHLFTAEKIKVLSDPIFHEKTLLLDLDILILKDLTDYLENVEINKVIFNRNDWQSDKKVESNLSRCDCKTNSGFVISKAKYAKIIEDALFGEHFDYYSFKYKSLDRVLEIHQDLFDTHQYEKLMYSYLGGAVYLFDMEPEILREDYHVCLFNNAREIYVNLEDNVKPWAKEMWEGYD